MSKKQKSELFLYEIYVHISWYYCFPGSRTGTPSWAVANLKASGLERSLAIGHSCLSYDGSLRISDDEISFQSYLSFARICKEISFLSHNWVSLPLILLPQRWFLCTQHWQLVFHLLGTWFLDLWPFHFDVGWISIVLGGWAKWVMHQVVLVRECVFKPTLSFP